MILGIDPGISGGAAIVSTDLKYVDVIAFARTNPEGINLWLAKHPIKHCYLEGVGAFPGQGVVSTFKFGMNYGWWQGLLTGHKIDFVKVYPLKWQTALNCRTGGNKNISKTRAQELFPSLKITHAIADALLIAEYGRRQRLPTAEYL